MAKNLTINDLKYQKKCDDHLPVNWNRSTNNKILVPVDDRTKRAIENMVENTWQDLVGKGRDADNLDHTGLKVIMVQRVQNPKLFAKYQKAKNDLLDKRITLGGPSRRIGDIKGSREGNPATTQTLEDFMKVDLCPEINESYVLHGTKLDRIGGLIHGGFNTKNADPNAMFGKGIYTTDSSTKADQYADFPEKRRPLNYRNKLILSRILLGDVYLCTETPEKDSEKLKGPLCMSCLKDTCRCNEQKFDSLLGERHLRFREFVTYNNENIYPEYVITYKRFNSPSSPSGE